MNKKTDAIDRFWKYVKKSDGCWEWHGGINSTGRGIFWFNGKTPKAHRISYEIHYGTIPTGKLVLHKCDNGKCVRPDHLFLGNHKDNTQDMIRKGRAIGNRQLTRKQYEEIRSRWSFRKITHQILASEYGVHESTIQRICASL